VNYSIFSQGASEVREAADSPAFTMGEYLDKTGQFRLLGSISFYSSRRISAGRMRMLYMNDAALAIWRAMGHVVEVLGMVRRPPQEALLTFGVPFNE
jgi:hypothetical protein